MQKMIQQIEDVTTKINMKRKKNSQSSDCPYYAVLKKVRHQLKVTATSQGAGWILQNNCRY